MGNPTFCLAGLFITWFCHLFSSYVLIASSGGVTLPWTPRAHSESREPAGCNLPRRPHRRCWTPSEEPGWGSCCATASTVTSSPLARWSTAPWGPWSPILQSPSFAPPPRWYKSFNKNLNSIASPSWLEAFLVSLCSYQRASWTGTFIKLSQSWKSLHHCVS